VDAPLDRAERIGVAGAVAFRAGRLVLDRVRRLPLGQPVGQAHADRLPRLGAA
jgi:hypothetical protein